MKFICGSLFFQGYLAHWDTALDSQAKAFLVGVREALPLMSDGGRIFAITYAEGSRTGGLQPWVGMGSAKAALESLVRYFAVAVAKRRITVNAISPGWTEDSVLNTLPEQVQHLIRNWHVRAGRRWDAWPRQKISGMSSRSFAQKRPTGSRDR